MKNYDPNLGTRKAERRRFRLFLLIMLPLAGGLGYLATLNPPDPSKPQTQEQRVSFTDAVREIWSAIKMTYTMDLSSGYVPSEPRNRN